MSSIGTCSSPARTSAASAKVAAFLLTLTAALVGSCDAADTGCTYKQKLINGQTYYVYNPGYPNQYRGRNSCQWTATSDYRVKLSCTEFNIPPSNDCSFDNLSVRINKSTTFRYCGNEPFTVESEGNEMIVSLTTSLWSLGGKFLCTLEAVEWNEDNDDCRCGWKNPTRIVGGVESGVNEYPMMAAIVDSSLRKAICGSTIITDRHVITAAHCIKNKNPATLGVLIGEHDLSTGAETNATKLHKVARSYINPDYDQPLDGADIAILETEDRIAFGAEVGPACLPFQHATDSFGGNYVDLLGWGATSFGGPTSTTLQKVTLSVITNTKCRKSYPAIKSEEICTKGEGKDACQFDSGGPVLWQNPTSRQLLIIGIISYGRVCGGDAPGVNTRIGSYIDWIQSITPNYAYCKAE